MNTQDMKQLGEFGLIDLIKRDTINDSSSVVEGIGDDAAVILATPRQLQLLTTDMLVENVHFDLALIEAWQLGYKAIAVNLSDIAAMGGAPKQVLISLALPRNTDIGFVENLYKGMKEICREFAVNIVGGDTVSSPHGMVLNVAVLGEVEPTNLVKRAGASRGDFVVVTGTLGNSAAGLELLFSGGWEEYAFAWPLVTAHLTPRPQVRVGQALARMGISSMNDISDGLASEVNEIAAAGSVGARIFAEKIPLSGELKSAGGMLKKSLLEYALFGGEDYQLVFTVAPARYKELTDAKLGVPLTVVGEVTEQSAGVVLVMEGGMELPLEPKGYNHFR